jgi:glyoxylate/hydroxypyruvate reductase A
MHDDLLGGIGDAARIEHVLESALRRRVELAHGLPPIIVGRNAGNQSAGTLALAARSSEWRFCVTILFCSDSELPEPWRLACARAFPRMAFRVWPDTGPVDQIRYALVWRQQPGALSRLPNLKAILVLGAGVDSVLDDPELPVDVPVLRLMDAGLSGPMAEYALYAVLHFQRRMADYFEQQRSAIWQRRDELLARRWPVGVMGLGVLGATVARRIAAQGYPVAGWSRSGNPVEGIEVYAGAAGFDSFLARSRVLINVLPLTPHTRDVLDARTFSIMPAGSYMVNIGRGGHVNEADLIAALDAGQLAGAMLDVFDQEPLPAVHPFWRHPKIIVTPHVAAPTLASESEAQVVENIGRLERGEQPLGPVDRNKGY